MSKRGRSWKKKLKNKLGADKLAGAKIALQVKKKATKEQLGKIKRGFTSFMDIQLAKKEFDKLYKEIGDESYKDRSERLEVIIAHLKKSRINEAKKLGDEYDKVYPDDF